MLLDEIKSPDESTFQPLKQEVHSNIKYNGMGYMPCNGYVPCQPDKIMCDFLFNKTYPHSSISDRQLKSAQEDINLQLNAAKPYPPT